MRDPEKNSPKKIDIPKLKLGLSKSQYSKIAYECDLLRINMDKLISLAPFLFIDGITAANTSIISEPIIEHADLEESTYEHDEPYYYSDYP